MPISAATSAPLATYLFLLFGACATRTFLQQKAENVQQEQDAHAVQISEEALVIVQWNVVGDRVRKYVRYTHYDQQFGIYKAHDNEK